VAAKGSGKRLAVAVPVDRSGAVDSARRTLATEHAGLAALAEALDNGLALPFARTAEILRTVTGRVVVSGVGKSGHIGRKIAATFASTGTPALFVHPAEASHGDLGMITPDDAILVLSWSGETAELRSLVEYARRFRIPLIATTAYGDSSLARQADVVLLLPQVAEACPHGLAPTTSTLLQLALGDALAIALLEGRGFTAEDFHKFHPGGKLGASLHFVRDIMHRGHELPLAELGTTMSEAIVHMTEKGFGCLGIVDGEGALRGIITDGDLRRHIGPTMLSYTVDDVMTKAPKTVAPDLLVGAALDLLNRTRITAIFVVEEARPVGIVHMHDLLRIGVA
jgi:arabinose-5-phosphate isomerase